MSFNSSQRGILSFGNILGPSLHGEKGLTGPFQVLVILMCPMRTDSRRPWSAAGGGGGRRPHSIEKPLKKAFKAAQLLKGLPACSSPDRVWEVQSVTRSSHVVTLKFRLCVMTFPHSYKPVSRAASPSSCGEHQCFLRRAWWDLEMKLACRQ